MQRWLKCVEQCYTSRLEGENIILKQPFLFFLCARRKNVLPSTLLSLTVKLLIIFCSCYVHIKLVSCLVIMYT